ncbi:cation diffusion facilitator family transporter [Anaerovorax odorimutans]|uniref:Cation diffusion facilitator family transporter n=2 Tax=Anaerovorax odorimutans TaxID=109327 RepID=A0ABT1RP28_9FIRM|nr:cation diffusion facilitator family transporter [Anaerovorax odorimutans]MCQ4636923.1 cation diffusion facilitator family transporter [Anaerovorax odorimutans]
MRVSIISIAVNLFLSAFKLAAGLLAHSGAMISDAVHSASDVLSTLIVIAGVSISGKKSDREHPYGHERMECVASILLAIFLLATGIGIGFEAAAKILAGNYEEIAIPGKLALIAAVVSIGIKEWMYWYTRRAAKKINSGALMADAWHHRSDALSSVGAFVGILGARMGLPIMDPLASAVICVFIAKASIDIFRDAMDKMVDKACDAETVDRMIFLALSNPKVKRVDEMRTRMFGARSYVDIEIAVDENLSLKEAHRIAEEVHHAVEKEFPQVKHCMVHVNPEGSNY